MTEERRKAVHVTESFLPPKKDFMEYVDKIFKSHSLTNQGPFVTSLERDLREYLDVPQLTVCSNGTLALQLALRLLKLDGKKIITTPFTYVATLSALIWENCEPVFADIDPESLCLDPEAARRVLKDNPDAAGLMPVHVFGNACDVSAFADLAKEYNLQIIYDAAHAFGSKLYGKSLLDFGDSSTCSFHATKIFHTVEGGCIITHCQDDAQKLSLLRAFGHIGDRHICAGINAKMSELHAAMGLSVLKHMHQNLEKRKSLAQAYNKYLSMDSNSQLAKPRLAKGLEWNHAYYPLIFRSQNELLKVMEALNKENIFPRRYFYPSLTTLPYSPKQACPISDDISKRIACLPFWADMPLELAEEIATIILKNLD